MNITPMKKKVLIAEVDTSEIKSESGIIMGNHHGVYESKKGCVLAIGPDVTSVAVGDVVLLEWHKCQVVKINDAQRVVIEEENIIAVVE